MELQGKAKNISIILQKPKYAGNIGAAARAAKNMGIINLVVVGSAEYDQEEVKKRSTHLAADIVEKIKYVDDIRNALDKFSYIVGTTARKGAARGPFFTPRAIAEQLTAVSQNNKVALLFGPEDTGLTNEELRYCHAVVVIPSSRKFTSLNLSHAVMIMCYEIFIASLPAATEIPPKLARSSELEEMYEQIKTVLTRIGFLTPQNSDYWMTHIRKLFNRTSLLARDVKIIRGICRQIQWYNNQKNT
jgi:tRNA/rRNA methyltransferase